MTLLRTWVCGFIAAAILCTQVPQPSNETVKVIEVPVPTEVVKYVPVYMSHNPSRGSQRELEMVATAYTHTGDLTFTGLPTDSGLIAVDPNVIPLGSLVWVEGYGYAIAADTGNRDYIGGLRIDVLMNTEAEAVKWGVRRVRVKIIR